MRNFVTHKSRQPYSIRFLSGNVLSGRRASFLPLFTLLVLLSAFVVSCERKALTEVEIDTVVQVDSTLTTVVISKDSSLNVGSSVYVLVYSTEGTRSLESMTEYDHFQDTIRMVTTENEKIIAVIANSPKALYPVAFAKYDSLEQLSYEFTMEDTELPVLGGWCTTERNTGEIRLSPLMCKVVLTKISNTMPDYELVESPRIRLLNINASAKLMQTEPFYPTEIIEYGDWAELPYDIGLYSQSPGTTLYCYPNESDRSVLGSYNTAVELECVIFGEQCSFESSLPEFGRGSIIELDIVVNGPDSFSCNSTIREY